MDVKEIINKLLEIRDFNSPDVINNIPHSVLQDINTVTTMLDSLINELQTIK